MTGLRHGNYRHPDRQYVPGPIRLLREDVTKKMAALEAAVRKREQELRRHNAVIAAARDALEEAQLAYIRAVDLREARLDAIDEAFAEGLQ